MARVLLIAEKPSLMREIQSVYNKYSFPDSIDFESFAGHTLELKKPGEYNPEWGKKIWDWDMIPMIPNEFEYKVSKEKINLYNRLKNKIETGHYDFIVNACDPDREGEHIFRSFMEKTNCKLPCKRFWTNDLTNESIKKQLDNLRSSNEDFFVNLGHASKLRAEFDWLIGINLTVVGSLSMKNVVKLGRVKTPTLKILVDRELEIRNFKPTTYWQLEGLFKGYNGTYFNEDGVVKFKGKEEADKIIKNLKKEAIVQDIEKKTQAETAPALYSLNSLQSDASSIYGFAIDKTKAIAQSLYEKKITSYPRTDNPCISSQLVAEFPKMLKPLTVFPELKDLAEKAIVDKKTHLAISKNTKYVNDKKMAESGHFAITPTGVVPNLSTLTPDELKILDLVYRRFLAIFLPPKKVSKTTIISNNNNYLFRTTGAILLDKGYSILYKTSSNDVMLPNVNKGDKIDFLGTKLNEKTTTPPPRYTDGTLVSVLENPIKFLNDGNLKDILRANKGIGTTATRDTIVNGLIADNYIERKKARGKAEYLYATDKGISIIENIKDFDIAQVDMTGTWEEKLGEVEQGILDTKTFKDEMIKYVLKSIDDFKSGKLNQVANNVSFIGACPKCNKQVKETKDYYICSGYKQSCDFIFNKTFLGTKIPTKEMAKILAGEVSKEFTFKKKDKTTFKAKLVYDKAQNQITFANSNTTSKEICKCPNCKDGSITQGKNYYKCSNYPNTCKTCIPLVKNETKITVTDVKKLLKGEKVEKEFTWSSGKKGKAKIKLENGFIKFDF